MQLHACVLLFIITTDKALALSQHPCGANISLDQGPAGSIHLTPPGRFNHTNGVNATSHGAPPPSACTWVLQVPPGRTVLLAPSGLERGWALAVGCVRDQDDHVLGSEGTVVLSRCDNDTATLSWRADGGSARSAGLRYYVQEDERNSTEGRAPPPSQTAALRTSPPPAGPDVVTGTEEGRGRLHQGPAKEASSPRPPTRSTSQFRGPLRPTAAGNADREALLFPEETTNNGADASGATHLAGGPVWTRPDFQNTFHTSGSTNTESYQFPTQRPRKPSAAASSADTSQLFPTSPGSPSGSIAPSPTSPPPDSPSWNTWKAETPPSPRQVSPGPGEEEADSPSSTDGLTSDLTSGPGPTTPTFPPATPNATTPASASSVQASQTFTSPPPSQASSRHSTALAARSALPHVTSPSPQRSKDTPTTSPTSPTSPTLRDSGAVSLPPGWIIAASSSPRAASPLEDGAQKAAATGPQSQTQGPTFTRFHRRPPTVSSPLSSAPSHSLRSHTGSPSTLQASTTPAVKSTASHLTPPTAPGSGHKDGAEKEEEKSWQWLPSSTPGGSSQKPRTTLDVHPGNPSAASSEAPASTSSHAPRFFIVPDRPAAIKAESIQLLLQVLLGESSSASGLESEAAAWLEPFLQRAPGFSRLQGVWSSGHAVQCLVEFRTSGALQWLGTTGPASLLERTGLAQAVHQGQSLRSSKITDVTLGGLQADVCQWLLQCPAGYNCMPQPATSNYSCSSACHSDFCHHHGICTHHPGQLPVCRCLVGNDFWYMGQRCDLRMTRARLVGACVAILLVIVTVIGLLAFVAVRRYKAILIQAKVDQTRSSYRRFNHFDELSGRFWLRSWAGSADSLDNPAFTRSNELLHLRALDRPCCYHDDTLSLASTCPSHGTRINTIYPHSSQYGWRGSEASVGDGVLDSGKASDLSVCSWPVEPIHWTPFPLLQQLASHRTPTVRVSRPRSYCEGMELVDLRKSWTA